MKIVEFLLTGAIVLFFIRVLFALFSGSGSELALAVISIGPWVIFFGILYMVIKLWKQKRH